MKAHEPVLKQALGAHWEALAPVIRAHYGLTPFTDEQVHLKGSMDRVSHSRAATLLIPFARLVGALVPFQGHNVPVDVLNQSQPDEPAYFWRRTFYFPSKKPFVFRSRTRCTGPGEITEDVRFGLGIRLGLTVRDGGLVEIDRGYVWNIATLSISLPINAMVGTSYIEEMPLSDSEFEMRMAITHRLFGETFAYTGRFAVVH